MFGSVFVPVDINVSINPYLIIATLVAIVSVLQFHWNRRHMYQLAAKIPGPPTVPILGNAHLYFGKNSEEVSQIILQEISEKLPLITKYGMKLWFAHHLCVFIANPVDLQIALNSPFSLEKNMLMYKFMKNSVGVPLLYKPVHKWKPHRRYFSKAFTKSMCDKYVALFSKDCAHLVSKVRMTCGKPNHDIEKMIDVHIVRTSGGALIGKSYTDEKEIERLVYLTARITELIFIRIYKLALHNDFLYKFTSLYKEEISNIKEGHESIKKVIDARKEQRRRMMEVKEIRKYENEDDTKLNIGHKLLSDLSWELAESGELTEREMFDEVLHFLGAGADTATHATYHTLVMLAMHKDIQDKVYEEVLAILDNSDREIDAADVREMKYLDMVVKETLRKYPIVPIIGRNVTHDLKLESCIVPKGARLMIMPVAVHHNPELWPEPEKFDPERFSPENSINRHTYSFIPFSGGPRNCIGYRFAMLLMKTTVASIVRNFRMEADGRVSDLKMRIKISARIYNAPPITFHERKL